MVNYQTYITIALEKCGGGRENMTALGRLWTNEKDRLKEMTEEEVRERLNCP